MKLSKWYLEDLCVSLFLAGAQQVEVGAAVFHKLQSLYEWFQDEKDLSSYLDGAPELARGSAARRRVVAAMRAVIYDTVLDDDALWDADEESSAEDAEDEDADAEDEDEDGEEE